MVVGFREFSRSPGFKITAKSFHRYLNPLRTLRRDFVRADGWASQNTQPPAQTSKPCWADHSLRIREKKWTLNTSSKPLPFTFRVRFGLLPTGSGQALQIDGRGVTSRNRRGCIYRAKPAYSQPPVHECVHCRSTVDQRAGAGARTHRLWCGLTAGGCRSSSKRAKSESTPWPRCR